LEEQWAVDVCGGATKAEYFAEIRKIIPDSFLLVPGVGAQGEVYRKYVSTG